MFPHHPFEQVDVKKEAKMWKRKNADQRVRRTFKTADEVLKVRQAGRTAWLLECVGRVWSVGRESGRCSR